MKRNRTHGWNMEIIIFIFLYLDEENGGALGWGAFIQTDEFRALNVGFHLDEGNASPTDVVPLFYGERSIWS